MILEKKAAPVPSLGERKTIKQPASVPSVGNTSSKTNVVTQLKKERNSIYAMQEQVQNIAKIILNNSSNKIINGVLSSNSNTGFNVLTAMKEIINDPKKQPDGIWGLGTQEALNFIYRVAVALLNTNTKFDLKSNEYNLSDLSNFRKLISGYEFINNRNSEPLKQQNARAKIISTHIQALISYYNSITSSIIKDPRIKTDEKTLVEYKKRSENLNERDKELLNQFSDDAVHIKVEHDGKTQQISVPIWVLENKNNLAGWLEKEKTKIDILKGFDTNTFFNEVLKPQLA